MKKVAFIPARSGSKRIKDKNIKILNNHPLIAYSITAAIKSEIFDSIIFATDSQQYASIAKYYGAKVPFLREESISSDNSPDIEWVKYMLSELKKNGEEFEVFSILRPTSPFRLDQTIVRAFNMFINSSCHDSLRALEKCSQHPGKMWKLSNNNAFPLMPFYNGKVPWHSSQYPSLPEIYVQNASLEISWTKNVFDKNSISGDLILPFITQDNEGFDINTINDFELAKILLKNNEANTIEIDKVPYDIFK